MVSSIRALYREAAAALDAAAGLPAAADLAQSGLQALNSSEVRDLMPPPESLAIGYQL